MSLATFQIRWSPGPRNEGNPSGSRHYGGPSRGPAALYSSAEGGTLSRKMTVTRSAIVVRDNAIGCVLLVSLSCGGGVEHKPNDNGGTRTTLSAAGGARSTAGTPAGGVSAGGASGLAGASGGASGLAGASGGASGTDGCRGLNDDHCVTECLDELVLVENAICANGAWICPSHYVLASSCPQQACGVTPDACCNMTTGIVTENPCNADGLRRACPDGSTQAYLHESFCVPRSLEGMTCASLDGQSCTGPAVGCDDMSKAFVHCSCAGLDAGVSNGIWRCGYFIGP
jgi:hypothetical protein